MRFLPLAAASFTFTLLAGCASAPNQPTKELLTAKSPEAFSACVMQKLQENQQSPNVTHTSRSYRVILSSPVAADNVIETFKGDTGGKVYVYQRGLFSENLVRVASQCA
ncbi:hypothetical protein C163_18340 [Pseudomonas sp. FGI182]|uniref:hypothetical protein n=1 Tax=Pseudomonas TaxID=286 RepID=UPI0003D945C4|nr:MULTISPECIES: hypothetical protein [Pseudomonas]AHD15608.1 hypothetical protein C163_18340 [Pseudomonas sp. FGI182]WJN49174.1 hypothetical protein QUR91_21365 [Pseudomonas asiatica]